ncbi:glycosyltransferase family 4 protein [Flavobacterium sp. NG2]|uniref:glycosyltransferase family 4 protein n=1 Tax=Flavobacterium sp. NG2 TaxID=3097547 RepID=UPI002A8282A3|nr:glycosyltransferase family 4 protein [Flavobacterium sp. NG2]WPR71614.1 glycosyltransferase family 4 protein [Flavobacterium sp. NG2]
MKKILFISHDATRTGAPILLLNLVKLILSFGNYEVNFILLKGGELESEFKDLAPTFCLNEKKSKGNLLRNRFFKMKSILEDSLFLNQYHCIVSNTITNGGILEIVKSNYNGPIVSYVHELEIACKTYTTTDDLKKVIQNTDVFCVPCNLVKDFLHVNLGVSYLKISELPYYIHNKSAIVSGTNLHHDQFIIGGCGTIDWRKGPDLFVQVATQLFLLRPDISIVFKWKGAYKGIELERLQYQLEKANLGGKVFFEFTSDNMATFYDVIDLLLLTSREDPYPLVVLEAASYAKPSICFDEVCGSKDFINKSDGGIVVPFLDIQAIVSSILKFYDDESYRKQKGENAKHFLLDTHSNKQYVYNEFETLIKNLNLN